MRSNEAIEKEVAALCAIAASPTFRKTSAFGDNNTEAIEAQIESLNSRLSLSECFDREDSEDWSAHVASNAREAVDWLNEDTDDGPAEGWSGLY